MILRITAAAALLAATLSAQIVAPQPISFTGVVRALPPSPGPPILCAPGTHEIECAEGLFQLQSSTLILSALEGQNVKLFATAVSKFCPLFEETGVDLTPPATLDMCGTPGLGCPVRLVSGPGALSQHFLFVSATPGLYPVSIPAGSLMLGPPLIFLGVGFASGPEGAVFEFNIPSNPQLIGLSAYLQVARRDIGPVGPVRWSNARCLEILGYPIVCYTPTCAIG